MTITPKQAREMNEKDKGNLAELERKIDAYLKENYNSKPTYIGAHYPGEKVFGELQRIYKAAGWTVRYENDQREGDYLVFSEGAR
jgi:hypothetical protein